MHLWRPIYTAEVQAEFKLKASRNGCYLNMQSNYVQAATQVMQKYAAIIRPLFPESVFGCLTYVPHAKTWADMTPQIYVTFWMHSLYDLEVPHEAYGRLVDRLKQAVDQSQLSSGQKAKEMERVTAVQKKVRS